MKQAKLRAAGENRSREEVVRVIIEESVEAAKIAVVERFDEIAKERGLDDKRDVGENRSRDRWDS